MILRLASPVARRAFLAVSAFLACAVGYYSLRNARAERLAGLQDANALIRATQLEPGNARNWYLLGRYWQYNLDSPDNTRAIASYQQSLFFDPRSPATWVSLGEIYEMEGHLASARQSFLYARENYPVSAEVAWRYGNFLLRRGEFSGAYAQIYHAVSEEPSRAAEAVSRCWRANADIEAILRDALPASPRIYVDALNYLAARNETGAALAVWNRLFHLHPQLPVKEAYPLLDALIQQQESSQAREVWAQALDLAGLSPPADPPGSNIFNGGFESEIVGGLAWRIQPAPGAAIEGDTQTKRSGFRSLRIQFDGSRNMAFEGVCQYVPVEPQTSYRLSAWVRVETLTTDRGLALRLSSVGHRGIPPAVTAELRGTEPWTQVSLSWTPEKDTRIAQVCAIRAPSQKIDNKISGTAWIDDVALTPVSSFSPAKAASRTHP